MSAGLIFLIVLFEYLNCKIIQFFSDSLFSKDCYEFFDPSFFYDDHNFDKVEYKSYLLRFILDFFCCTDRTKVYRCRSPPYQFKLKNLN